MADDIGAEERAKVFENALRPVEKQLAELSPDYDECSMVAFAIGYNVKDKTYSITLVTNNPDALSTLLQLALDKALVKKPTAMEKPSAPTRVIH